jgi:hypothetical protein
LPALRWISVATILISPSPMNQIAHQQLPVTALGFQPREYMQGSCVVAMAPRSLASIRDLESHSTRTHGRRAAPITKVIGNRHACLSYQTSSFMQSIVAKKTSKTIRYFFWIEPRRRWKAVLRRGNIRESHAVVTRAVLLW